MRVFDYATRHFDIFLEGMLAAVDHNGGEAAVHTGLTDFEVLAVIKMQADRQTGVLNRRLDQLHQIDVVGVFARASGYLQNQGGLLLLSGSDDTLNDFHVINVEGTNGVVTFIGFFEHFGRCY